MSIEAVSINGQVYPGNKAEIKALDRGFMFGHGAFETFRVSGGSIFLLKEHFKRLQKNLGALGIVWQYDPNKHLEWLKKLSDMIPATKDGRLRFCVTSGDGVRPNVIIYLSLIDKFASVEKEAQILKTLTRHKPEYFDAVGFRIKTLEYSYLYIARQELADRADGILLNPEGYVAEGLTSNIFWVHGGKIYTPPLSLGILAGTVRSWLLERVDIEEKLIRQEELLQADEIFLTAGASYLIALSSIDGQKKPGIDGETYDKIYRLIQDNCKENSLHLS